ncbi:8237_t:CDS:1 [Acaulospora morrowiae]|uniref:8237_t:CDS:1 n=1 Tax=Acaulospora morrowiae TaxID=94023 RepID=A0A9N8ZD65_9GLOM|nr:8237_t:CDS:1 [Acaulospora morrowiae]
MEATLERFSNYPPSTIKDVIISRLVGEIRVQGRTFRTLTKASVNFETLSLRSSEFPLHPSEMTVSEVLREFDLIRKGYSDISNNLHRISGDFQTHRSNLEKELHMLHQEAADLRHRAGAEKSGAIKTGLLAGFGVGSLSNTTLYIIAPSLDGGLTLFATIITGGVLGWYYGNKLGAKLRQEAEIKEQRIHDLKNNTEYIDFVVKEVNDFDKGIGLFKDSWAKQFKHAPVSKQVINKIKKENLEMNNLSVKSLLASWTHAKSKLPNYQNHACL